VRQALIQTAAYVGIAVFALIGFIALSVSYGRNRAYVDEVADASASLRQAPAADASVSLTGDLPRLDALESLERVARKHENDVPFSMRWGLYQGHAMSNAVNDAYLRELNSQLLPAVANHFRDRLVSFAGAPDKLYEYLKAYLMLGLPQHLEPVQLAFLGNIEWRREFANDSSTAERVSTHFNALIEEPERVQAAALDDSTVQSARTSLRQASLPVLIYSRLKLVHAADTEHALDIATETGLGANQVFVSRSGRGLSQPMPALYSRAVFDEIATKGKLEAVGQFVSESWVLGEGVADLRQAPRLAAEVMNLYEDDYIARWDALLADLTLRKASGTQEAAELWGLLAAPTSPLKRLLVLLDAQTNLLKPSDRSEPADKAQKAVAGKLDALGKIFGTDDAPAAVRAGTKVTNHFAAMHKLVAGSPAPIDMTLAKFANVQSALAQINALGGTPPLQLATQLSLAVKDLETHAKTLPGPFESLVSNTAGQGNVVAKASIGSDFTARYRQQVAAECLALAAGRYPLTLGNKDLPLADFGRLFGANGVFETFFETTMRSFVDTNRPTWTWTREAASLGGPSLAPAQFQRADRIKQIFFAPGGAQPEVRFTLTPSFLDAAASRMTVEIDGQTLEYRHGPVRSVSMTWPGPSPGQAAIAFEERGGGGPNLVTQGPWALFRLLEQASVQVQSDTTFLVTFDLNGRTARLLLEAASSRNPFGRNVLQGFACAQ
jgi:type VI secretion system protein ImpL